MVEETVKLKTLMALQCSSDIFNNTVEQLMKLTVIF